MIMDKPLLGKQYYKIKDVAEMLGVQQSTLRFWEKEFSCLNPRRSASNVRYYTPADIDMLREISYLVRDRGLKLESAKEQMRLNRGNVSRRLRALDRLENVRNSLENLLKSLSVRVQALNIKEEEIKEEETTDGKEL